MHHGKIQYPFGFCYIYIHHKMYQNKAHFRVIVCKYILEILHASCQWIYIIREVVVDHFDTVVH
jgi:hypothetical protein